MPNPLRNKGYEDIIKFLLSHGCYRGATQGDDTIYYHPKNPNWGIKVNTAPKLKRSGYPIGTLNANIFQLSKSGISKTVWKDWFSEKRNIK